MPLPQLRTDYNVLVPDRAKSSRDAVNALLGVQNMQARTANEKSQMENALVKRQEEKAAAERKVISDDLDLIIKKANLGKTIAEATPEVREKIIKLYPEFDGVKAVGEDITIPYQNFGLEISGNQHNVSSFLKKVGENPELATNNPIPGPIKATGLQHLRAIAAAEGVTLKAIAPPKRTEAEEIEYQGRLAEEKARGKSKGEGPKEDKYLKDKGAIVDDTNTFYRDKAKSLLDPDSGLVRFGPDGDENKYLDEYNQLFAEKAADMVRIRKGELPSWLQGDVAKPEPKPKEFTPVEVEEAKRAMAQAHDELLSSGALEGLSKEDAFELTKKRARELTSGVSQGL